MGKRALLMAGAWLALLALSRVLEPEPPEPLPGLGEGRVAVQVAPQSDEGPLAGPRAVLSLLHWPASGADASRTPLVCLHGSPGSARNFERLGPVLAASGWDVWALDLPGFGRSRGPVGGYSIRAHARSLLAVLDALGLERVHLLGWSLGGGVALEAAELAPQRVASLSLVASIGVQEAEGSGSYAFEHVKYLLLLGLGSGLDELVPHFGRLAALRRESRSFALNFWQTDQRPLRGILERLRAPTLIVHGREDVLVPLHAAVITHELVHDSRLVVLDANHFLPLLQVEELSAELEPFLARHDEPGAPEPRARVEQTPSGVARRWEPGVLALGRALPWWLQLVVVAWACAQAPFLAATIAGALVGAVQLDFGLVAIGLALGALVGLARRRERRLRSWMWAPLRAWGWMLLVMLCALLAGSLLGPSVPRSLAPLLALAAVLGVARLVARAPRPSPDAGQTLG